MSNANQIAAIDLGEDLFKVIIAEPKGTMYEIVAYGIVSAKGFARGSITNIGEVVTALEGAVRQATVMANTNINGRTIGGVSGDHLHGETKRGHVKIQGGDVTNADIELALDTLQAFPISNQMEILHVLEQNFLIDGHGDIRHPLGMQGHLLEAEALVITARKNALANIRSSLEKVNASSCKLMSSSLAAAVSVTTEDERDLGVIVFDWGSGTCDYTIFNRGNPFKIGMIKCGGIDIDRDIAKIFTISLASSQKVKHSIGSAVQVGINKDESITVKEADGVNTKEIEPHVLSMAIEARALEMLEIIKQEIGENLNKDMLPAGVVITGGMAKLRGIQETAHNELALPVRLGKPNYTGKHNEETTGAEFAVVHGLIQLWISQGLSLAKPQTGNFISWLKSMLSADNVSTKSNSS